MVFSIGRATGIMKHGALERENSVVVGVAREVGLFPYLVRYLRFNFWEKKIQSEIARHVIIRFKWTIFGKIEKKILYKMDYRLLL